MSDEIDQGRRRFLGTAAMSVAAAKLGVLPSVDARSRTAGPVSAAPLDATKRIDAGALSVGYAEAGPAGGPAVILLHGWPYDIQSFAEVAPILASAGYRVIVPYLRGYGSTRLLSSEAVRNGQPAALAVDVIDLMDALRIQSATLAGFDWGARSADIVAALWPERCKALVAVSGYLIGSQAVREGSAAPAGRAPVVVPVLLCDRARPCRLRQEPARLCKAHLAARFAEVELRRCHVRPQRRVLRQPGSRRDRDPQLPVAARAGGRRAEVRRAGEEARPGPGHHGAHDHPRRRCQRRAAPGARSLRREIPGQVPAPDHQRGRGTQSAPGGTPGLCEGGRSTSIGCESAVEKGRSRFAQGVATPRSRSRSARGQPARSAARS